MNHNLIKTGSWSIVLGKGHYGSFVPSNDDKLFKVTKIDDRHNEFKYLKFIREIDDYEKYYSIPDKELYIINQYDSFYSTLIHLTQYDKVNIFTDNLNGFYINYSGDNDLIDSISDIELFNNFSVWNSYKVILRFIKFMLDGLYFLHEKKICHLDIKPENIIVNRYTSEFRIIDFGFASKEPFTDFLNDIKGTPGYFPKYFKNDTITPWLPKIEANDFIKDSNGLIPIFKNEILIYKIDSYCLGRVLYYLKYIYDKNKQYCCFNYEKRNGYKIDKIISKLLENDVYKRLTINECRLSFFD